jgi:hypothetical protein
VPGRRYFLLSTTAVELIDPSWPLRSGIGCSNGVPGLMPQLIWPADEAWIIATGIDVDSTLIGGSLELIRRITADRGIEAVTVRPGTDLSSNGDGLNRPG